MVLLWSCTVSVFPLGSLLGSLMVGLLVDKCSRKGTLLISNIFTLIPAILRGVSKVAKAFELIVFSPVVLGVCTEPGISYSTPTMYPGELAPKNLRGTLGAMTEVSVIVGIFLAQISSLQAILGHPTGTGSTPRLARAPGTDRGPHAASASLSALLPQEPAVYLIQKRDESARQPGHGAALLPAALRKCEARLM
ncbi:hypothetical protein HPG69_006961 [Diceros bicornis minor]|uniref:Major facilitator superfamily (MFS) profile domain-containing protein n=1 Tax=Diceros bicornis minor TaxID=77932 RepID=A0A7J7ENV0_DICBM|nr:hypothetical protein HPG69_006961 [Diceros bicornis minor]